MDRNNTDRTTPDQHAGTGRSGLPAGLVAGLIVVFLALLGIGARWHLRGDFNVIHCLLSLFFSLNLLICYWEICLYFRRDRIGTRAEYWRTRGRDTGRTPAVEFLTGRVPLTQAFSPSVWTDAWAAYCMYDDSYADRKTLGFTVDIGNGFVTPLPTIFLYAAFTAGLVPAVVAGIVGAMVSWQWVYVSSLYWVSFFVAGRHKLITRGELNLFVIFPNSIWIAFGVWGMYVSTRLILDGNYGILGY